MTCVSGACEERTHTRWYSEHLRKCPERKRLSQIAGENRSSWVPSSTARPRRWCDAGSPEVNQKAGAPGRNGNGHAPPTRWRSFDSLGGTRSLRMTWKKDRPRACGKNRSPGRAGHAIVPMRPSGYAARFTQWRCRATLAEERPGAAVHVAKQAAGVPTAWSQSFQSTFARPRRWCDAGTPQAARKAGVWGSRITWNISHAPAHPTITRTRDPSRSKTEGGASPTLRSRRRTRRPVLREASRPQDLRTSRPQDLRTSRPQDLRTSRPQDLRTSRPQDLRTSRPQDLRTSRPQDLRTSRPQDLRTSRPQDLRTSRPQDLRTSRPHDPRNSNTYRTPVTMMTRQSMILIARAGTNFCARAPQYIPAAPPRPKSRPSAQSGPTPIHE